LPTIYPVKDAKSAKHTTAVYLRAGTASVDALPGFEMDLSTVFTEEDETTQVLDIT